MKSLLNTLRGRIALSLFLALLLGLAASEGGFRLIEGGPPRGPQQVELVIPAGTAERVAAGEAPPSIPATLNFVAGDTLLVRNEDTVSHQLGPAWAPPGASASLKLESTGQYAYTCTFQPQQYQGLELRRPVTLSTRLLAALMAGPPTAILLFLYSLAIWPVEKRAGPAPTSP
jgi:hypothetical protein